MKPTPVRVFGLMVAAMGLYLALFPLITAELLGKPHDTSTQLINLRASWGGTLLGLGAFVAWLPAPRPWARAAVGLLMWVMAGVGAARVIGFVADGDPDTRQAIWITAEVAIVIACAIGLRVLARRRATA
jgi:Domain of unknown function (DUF4345)